MSLIATLLPSLGSALTNVLDRVLPDEVERERVKAEALAELLSLDQAKLEAATKAVIAEAKGESWLQRSWRPLVMLWLAGLVGAYWLGFSPENLPPEAVSGLLDIVQIGLGGYVLGRSGEKIARIWKQGDSQASGPNGLF